MESVGVSYLVKSNGILKLLVGTVYLCPTNKKLTKLKLNCWCKQTSHQWFNVITMLTINVYRPHLPIMLEKELALSYLVLTGPRYFYHNVWSWFKLFFPDCPSCKMRFSLAKGGCMHFNCPECGHEFCSGCSQMFDSKGVSFLRKK